MIGFTLNEEQEALRSTVEDFARQVVAPVIGGYYERGEFPYEIVARMGKLGLFGLPFPEEYGGMGGDYFAFCLALHELAKGRFVGGDHPGGGRGARRDADLPVRRRPRRRIAGCLTCARANGLRRVRPDRARRRLRHPAGCGPSRGWTAMSG